ncbi:MAG: ribonuclease III [Alphaproteobacteria bacterium]|nr:ribonuclease III [Alphaproteobacteria bacterium]
MAAPHGEQKRQGPLVALAGVLRHSFADPRLLEEALTHRSAARTDGHRFGNERLEFLGDRVLGLVVADLLLDSFPDAPEGELARRFTALVRREALEEVSAALDLGRFLQLSEAEARTGGHRNTALQADACEALIGALYRDGGLEAAGRFIREYWRPLLVAAAGPVRDPKTRLQEWAQARALALPDYRVVSETGPAHEPEFTIEVSVEGFPPVRAKAGTKRRAEQDAARTLLAAIDGENADAEDRRAQDV